MYGLIRESLPFGTRSPRTAGRTFLRPVSSTVILLGLTSLITDISSEMVTTVLPLFFVVNLGLTPLSFGIIDGLYHGVSAPLRIFGGYVADRLRLHKESATAGYGISALCKLGLLLASGALLPFVAILLLDRAGKGLRTAPRDAMISLSTPRDSLGLAFGVHRSLDAFGALAGPLLAFALLRLAPGAFDMIFVVSFCLALIGVSIIGLLVESRREMSLETESPQPSLRPALRLLRSSYFRRLVVIAGALSVFTISDGFFYLVLQRRLDLDFGFLPLLYVGTACAYFVLAVPAGMLADRFGRGLVFVAGYALLLLAYTALLRPATSPAEVFVYLALFGAYYAATDGVLMGIAAAHVPSEVRASGLALLTSVTSIGRFGGSLMFGLVWTIQGDGFAIALLLGGLLATIILALAFLMDEGDYDSPARSV
jgi:MFS family permease